MKYVLSAIALAIAAPAFAQSSVTVYGIVDVGGQYIDGHSKYVQEISGQLAGSRIGFKGSEDLGGGLRADFVLEGGLNIDTGTSAQGGALFGRQAFGALKTPYGTFSAGRQYSSIYVISGEFSAFSNTTGGAGSTYVLGGFAGGYEPIRGGGTAQTEPGSGSSVNGGPARVNNSFRYTSPNVSGFTASALYGAGEVTGNTWRDRLFDGSVRYTNYGVDAMVSYVTDKADPTAPVGTQTAANVDTIMGAASYAFGSAHIEGGMMHVNDKRVQNQDGNGYWVGGDYRVGPSLFKAQYLLNKGQYSTSFGSAKDNKTNVFAIGYQYDFSKRTAFYTNLARFQNGSATGLGRFDQGQPASGPVTTAADNDITEFAVGVRHSF